ncbi:helix-turn-helix domain-containing protein [Haloarcula nitratireducens]|uniref:Helix-turn-helix domain-containing protein n=1 Tax=Haloarcula nitratireducens TaxID=2487749 RepID=A0AAW4PFN6_9EURY|nr:helix-turn-helix domain-containing protein [Halomicroarcula nitratireducens]MBX0296769.1 helix-turn-helix domain-containing protein [Halomicroarcula nitratireducens]
MPPIAGHGSFAWSPRGTQHRGTVCSATATTSVMRTTNDGGDRNRSDTETSNDSSRLIVEFTVPADTFVLAQTLQAVPEIIVELEQFVPTYDEEFPYLWVTDNGNCTIIEEHAAADPTIATFSRAADLNGGALYEIEWADAGTPFLEWLQAHDIVVLEAEGNNDKWTFKLRATSRAILSDLQSYCDDHDIAFELIRLYELTDPKIGQYNITSKQREILLAALEHGYFEIPREMTLKELGDTVGITKRAASERLRRAHTNLVSNTLQIGQPTGVGINEDTP